MSRKPPTEPAEASSGLATEQDTPSAEPRALIPAPQPVVPVVLPEDDDDGGDSIIFDRYRSTPSEIRSACQRLRPLLEEMRANAVLECHEFGVELSNAYRDYRRQREAAHKPSSTRRFLQSVVEGLQADNCPVEESVLRAYWDLAVIYTRQEIEHACGLSGITVSHLMLLEGIGDPKQRRELMERTSLEHLTTRQLHDELRGIRGPQRQPGGGRRPRAPGTVPTALRRLEGISRQVLNLLEVCFETYHFHTAECVLIMPVTSLTAEFQSQLSHTIEYMDEAGRLLVERSQELAAKRRRLTERLTHGQQAEADSDNQAETNPRS